MRFNTSTSIEEHNISSFQTALVLLTYILSTAGIVLPASIAQEASIDGWLSVLMATICGIFIMYIYILITDIYPYMSLMEINNEVFGKFFGSLLNFLFMYYFFEMARLVLGEFGQFLKDTTNQVTPFIIFYIIGVSISILALTKGLEIVCRLNELLLPIGTIAIGLILIGNLKNLNFSNYLPLLDNGFYPVFKGTILLNGWLAELVIVIQLSKFIKERKHIKKILFSSVLAIGLSFSVGILIIAVFGSITRNLMYPAYNFVRYASFGKSLAHLDVLFISVWIMGIFIKISLLIYGFWSCVYEIFKIRNHNSLLFPIFLLLISMAMTTIKRDGSLILYLHYTFPLLSISMGYIIPIFILLCVSIKNKFYKNKKTN
ncbi:MAG: spore germination protein [Anaeromicrobium sp.]|jgi:spore germination protein KB|uniref:GerAB/ArcD/ProY family transporter n=1 Tax=Anaeromicrobium sp. TaxID=1929132 RepID=UPI0025E49229|nr:endospore germination permease [Anaeromicrobium sp.]MCT4594286.1 spore germination protein [Anaeromicrobium sp.]